MDHEPVICPRCGEVIPISDVARSYGYMVVGLRILDHLKSCNKEGA
jgi:hypothetical protein